MPNRHRGVFERNLKHGQKVRRKWVRVPFHPRGGYTKTLPIRQVFGISPWHFYQNQKRLMLLVRAMQKSFAKNFDHDAKFFIGKALEKA
jgi:hypothetical protein